jgi:hypothetical protein
MAFTSVDVVVVVRKIGRLCSNPHFFDPASAQISTAHFDDTFRGHILTTYFKSWILFFVSSTFTENMSVTFSEDAPPFLKYQNSDSFFGDDAPLPEAVGWLVVVGFGALFSVITTLIVMANKYFGEKGETTSEHFK